MNARFAAVIVGLGILATMLLPDDVDASTGSNDSTSSTDSQTTEFTRSDFGDLTDLNDADDGGHQSGTRAALVEFGQDDYEQGDGTVGL